MKWKITKFVSTKILLPSKSRSNLLLIRPRMNYKNLWLFIKNKYIVIAGGVLMGDEGVVWEYLF